MAIGLQRLLSWLTTSGEQWAGTVLGPAYNTPVDILAWILSIAAAVGIVIGAVFLMPAVTALIASIFVDEVADEVERVHYPAERPGTALPLTRALVEGIKTALLAVLLYLRGAAVLLLRGVGVIVFFLIAAYLLGREYFLLAAMRFRSVEEAKAFRKRTCLDRVRVRLRDRGVRVDPDRQSRDAAVRHGLHGPHAQAAVGPAAGIAGARHATPPTAA